MESTIRGREEDAASEKMQMSVFINKEFQKSQLFLKSVGLWSFMSVRTVINMHPLMLTSHLFSYHMTSCAYF